MKNRMTNAQIAEELVDWADRGGAFNRHLRQLLRDAAERLEAAEVREVLTDG